MMHSTASTPLRRSSSLETHAWNASQNIYTTPLRRKRSKPSWSSRCLVASPLALLVLWSCLLLLRSPESTTLQQSMSKQKSLKSVAESRGRLKKGQPKNDGILPVYVPLGDGQAVQQTVQQQQQLQAAPQQQQQGQGVQQAVQQQVVLQPQQQQNVVMMNRGTARHGGTGRTKRAPRQQQQVTMATPQQQQQVVMTSQQEGGVMQETSNVMQQPQNDGQVMAQQVGTAMDSTVSGQAMTNAQQQGNDALTNVQQQGNNVLTQIGSPAMQSSSNTSNNNIPVVEPLGSSKVSTRVLYYDPSDGDIPTTVYDDKGTPILLASLQTDQTEIYLERPQQQQQSTMKQQQSQTAQQYSQQESVPLETLQLPKEWGDSHQDQLIIISTVATMALLVGALSARRMRSRQFLSMCIENESLQHEVAYDTAYTLSNSYDTFGPWRGDLEKFDV